MSGASDKSNFIDMDPIFCAKNIAVIGCSKNKVSGMKFIFAFELSGYFKKGGKAFPINPKYDELYGYKVYPSIFDPEIPDIDLAIIAVPAKFVPDVVRECGKKGVKFAVIFSSGFAESGNYELQKELDKAVNEVNHITRFIGPNCLGINAPHSGIHYYPGMTSVAGNVSYVSMSGGMTARLTTWLSSIGLGMRNVVSIGNSIDLSATDFINYFREDPETRIIALYLESIPDGRKFIEAIKKTTPIKPIILFKGGQSEVGGKAAKSHTGGLAGSIDIWKAMAKQYGVIITDHFEQFADFVTAFSVKYHLPPNRNVGIVLAGGGLGVEYADMCINQGLNVPEFTPETVKKLSEVFPSVNTSFQNPVDLGEYGYVPDFFKKALEIVAADPNISSLIMVKEAERFFVFEKVLGIENMEELTISSMSEVLENLKKPAFCSTSPNNLDMVSYEARLNFKVKMMKKNLAVIDYIPNVCQIIDRMVDYHKFLKFKCGK